MIAKEYNVKLDLTQANQKEKGEEYINKYIHKKIAISANGIKSDFTFVGFEIQKESTWSYFEIKNVKQLKQLNIFCELLFGIDPQQINIIHVTTGGKRKSYELAAPKNTTQFLF
jgi:arabinogalactan endo-1,4-beta-galactosidase